MVKGRSKKSPSPAADSAANIDSLVKDSVLAYLNTESFIQKVVEAISSQISKIVLNQLETFLQAHTDKINDLQKQVESKENEIRQLREEIETKCDDQEQYSRRNNIRVFGIPESDSECCDELVLNVCKIVGSDTSLRDIDRCHRVGPKSPGKARPIIVKFTSYRARQEVFRNKRKLKGSGTTIREDLTSTRLAILKAAVERFQLANVWTESGDIIIKKPSGQKIRVRHMKELPTA